MDFEDTPGEARFRTEVRAWLDANARDYVNPLPFGPGDARLAELGRAWQRRKADGGFAAIAWPKDAGGLGASAIEELIFAEEEARYHVPVGMFVFIGINLAMPTIRAHGTPEQIQRYAHPTLVGDMLWCQLFSEPGAGSDLAAVRTRAVRDGDAWVVNGQKIWTSWGHTADFGIMLARTDPDVVKHRGLTFFIVDMRTPGIEVRPIRSITGESEFNEVFFTDVRIPDSQRLGQVGEGWKVAMTTLLNERVSVAGESQAVPEVRSLVEQIDASGKPRARYAREIATLYAREQGLKYFRCRLLTAMSRGQDLGSISVMSKLVYSHVLQDVSALGIDVMGMGQAFPAANANEPRRFHYGYQWAAALRIAGGADEILRNQIAERVLGMPGEVRSDKDLPFSKLPSGR